MLTFGHPRWDPRLPCWVARIVGATKFDDPLQMALLMLPLPMVATASAFVGCATFQGVLARMGFHVGVTSAAYAAAAVLAVSNPIIGIYAMVMVPVSPPPPPPAE